MIDHRQGNDLAVLWSIFKDGEPFDLRGRSLKLYLKNLHERKEVVDFSVTGNEIHWTFYGKDQDTLGKHSLILVANEDEKGMITTDACDFVRLVSCSCKLQGGEDAPNVETESIELTSTLEYVSGGGDYDDTALWRALDGKVDKVEGLGLSEENYTADEKAKLAGLENYDDSGIKEELAKKVESEVVVDTESTEDFEFGYDDTEIRQEIAELSAEVSGLSERIDNLPTAESSVFEAVYGETTYDEIVEAYLANKHCICRNGNLFLSLVELNYKGRDKASFSALAGDIQYTVYCLSNNTWGSTFYKVEKTTNKVTDISQSSTDTQYPSAKAVYDALQNVGGGASTDKQGVVSQRQQWSVNDGVYSYTMRNVVIGSIPQANIDLFTRVGAVFNEESGYFEMNGLTDISYEEMMDIYTYGNVPTLPNIEQYRCIKEVRTAILVRANTYYNQNMVSAFQYSTLESLYFSNESSPVNAEGLCSDTKYFHTLVIPDYSRGKKFWSNMSQLRVCQIAKIKANIELPISKLLTNESILYMIQNEIATSAIVITLHADAYARAMADSEITAALEAHPNVSLASA